MALDLNVGVKESSLQELERLAAALRSVDASLASLGKGNPMGVDSVNQQLTRMRREAAIGIQGIRNDLAELAALGSKKAEVIEKSAEEVAKAQEKAAAKEAAAVEKRLSIQRRADAMFAKAQEENLSGIDKYTASMMVGSAKIVDSQRRAAQNEEAARNAWRAKMMVGSAKIVEAQEKAAQTELQAAEKRASTQRRADAVFEQSQIRAADAAMQAIDKRLAVQRRADTIFAAAQAKMEADRVKAAAASVVIPQAPAATVITSGGGRGFDPGDVPKLKSLTAAMNDAHSAARGLASGFNAMFLTWGNLVPLLAGAAISNAFVQTIKLGADVSNTFEVIRNLSEETTTAVQGLNAQMLELARSGPFGPREVAEAMKTLSLAGLNAQEVGSSIKDVLNFAVAGDTSIKVAADVMSSVATAFKISADGYNYVGDVIAKTAAVSKSSIDSIGESFKTASVINSQYGASLEDVGTGLALLSNLGIQGTAAGTALRNMYVDLLGRTPKVEKALEKLGVSAIDPLTGKARDMISVFKDLDKALQNFDPTAQSKLLSDVFSERGGKGAIAALDALRSKAKEAGTDVASYLEEMRQKIQDSAGFMAIAAANMALTPLNQMKSVSAAFQATMVETFESLRPYITDTAEKLKAVFASEDFKRGLRDLVVGVAEVTKFMIEHADVIAAVAVSYGVLRASMAIGALFQAGAVMAASYSTALSAVATAQVGVATASVAASRGVGVLTTTMAAASTVGSAVMTGVSGLMTLLSRLSPWIMAAVAAWQLYSFWTDKGNEAVKNYSGANHAAYMEALDAEAKRLNNLADSKQKNVTLDALMRSQQSADLESQGAEKLTAAWNKVQQASANLNKLQVAGPSTNMTAYGLSVDRAQTALKKAESDYDSMRASVAAERQLRDQKEKAVRDAAARVRDAEMAEAKRRQDEFKSGTQTYAGAGDGKNKHSNAASNAYDRNPFTESEGVYKAEEKALKQYLSTEAKLLGAQRSEQLINEGQYQARLLMLTSDSEAAQLNALKVRGDAAERERAAEIQRIKSLGSADDVEKRRLEELEQRYGVIKAAIEAETDALKSNMRERKELASISSRGELAKLDNQTRDFWAKDQTELNAAKAMEAAKERLRYASQEEIAQYEATVAAQAKYERESLKIRNSLDKAVESQYEFNQALMSGTSITPEMVAKAQELDLTVEGLTKRWQDFNKTANERAAEAGLDAYNKVIRDKARAMSNELADALVDGIMHGGKSGGKALRSWLTKYFIQEPLTIMVRGVLSSVTGGLFSAMLGGGGAGGAGGGGGIMGLASNLMTGSSLYSGLTSGQGMLGSIGSFLGLGAQAATTTGIGVGTSLASPGMAALINPVAGTGTAVGAGGLSGLLGAIPGWGWALGGVALLGSMLSKRQTLHSGAGAIYGADSGLQSGAGIYNLSTFGMGDVREYNKDTQSLATGVATGLSTTLDGIAKAFGKKAGYEVATAFADDTSSDGAWGSLRISLGGQNLLNWNDTRTSRWAPREFADGEAGQKQYLAMAAQDARQLLLDMDLPAWADDLLNKIGEVADMDQLAAAVQQISQAQTAFASFGQYMVSFATMADSAKTILVQASGGVAALTANMSSFVDNFYTDSEKLAVNTANVKKALADLGFEMPTTREGFRDLVQAQIALGDAGAKTLAALLGLSGAFASITTAAQTAEEAAQALSDKLDKAYSALERAVSVERDRIQKQIALAEESVNSLKTIFDMLHTNIRELRGEVESTRIPQIQAGNDFIVKALQAAKATGAMPDPERLAEAIKDARTGLDASYFGGSTAERDYAALVLAGRLEGLKDIAGDQLTDAQRTLKELQAQSDQLDQILEYWQQQIDLAQGTYDGILTVTEAINNLQGLLGGGPGKPGMPAPGGGGGSTPTGGGDYQRVGYGPEEALTSFEKFKAWYQGIRSNADPKVLMDENYKVPDWMRIHNGADDGTDKELFGSYLFFKNNPQYAADYQQIMDTGRSSQVTDGSTLVRSDLSKMPADVAEFYRNNRDNLLATEGFGLDPVLAYQLYNFGPGQFGLDQKKQSFTEWLQNTKWTPEGLVSNNNVVSFAQMNWPNYKLPRWDTSSGNIVDTDGRMYTPDGKFIGMASQAQLDTIYGAGYKPTSTGPKSSLYQSQVGAGGSESDYYKAIKTNLDSAIAAGWSAQQLVDAVVSTGASMQDVANAYGIPMSQLKENLTAGGATNIPGFANGGWHNGGLRIVGERSWELEATGPSRIWTPEQLMGAMGGTDSQVSALLASLLAEVAELRAAMGSMAADTKDSRDVLVGVRNGNKLMTGSVPNW